MEEDSINNKFKNSIFFKFFAKKLLDDNNISTFAAEKIQGFQNFRIESLN